MLTRKIPCPSGSGPPIQRINYSVAVRLIGPHYPVKKNLKNKKKRIIFFSKKQGETVFFDFSIYNHVISYLLRNKITDIKIFRYFPPKSINFSKIHILKKMCPPSNRGGSIFSPTFDFLVYKNRVNSVDRNGIAFFTKC